MEELNKTKINPWLSMWTKPRETVQYIIDNNPDKFIFLLPAIIGINNFLNKASEKSWGDTMSTPFIFFSAVLAGSIGGIIGLGIFTGIIKWSGKWLKGAASYQDIRVALSWSQVPAAASILLWFFSFILFGGELFKSETPLMDSNLILVLIIGILEIVVGVWTFILILKTLSMVQKFSVWKAWLNLILPGLVIVVPLLLFVSLVRMIA